eukprot:4258619-Pyramimonas_sp.AAC.1
MATSLKRTGGAKYCGTLVAKEEPTNWSVPSLLLRFVDEQFAVPDLKLAGRTWPFKYSYAIQDWPSMNQLDAGAFVDILGKLEAKP